MPWKSRALVGTVFGAMFGTLAFTGVASANAYQITARCGAPFAVSIPKAEDGTQLVVTLNGTQVHRSTAMSFGDPLYWQLDNPDPTRSHTLEVLIDSVWNDDHRETRVVPACVVASTTTTLPPASTTTVPPVTTTPTVSVPPPPVPSSPTTSAPTTVITTPRPTVSTVPSSTVPSGTVPTATLPATGTTTQTDDLVNVGGIVLIVGLLLVLSTLKRRRP